MSVTAAAPVRARLFAAAALGALAAACAPQSSDVAKAPAPPAPPPSPVVAAQPAPVMEFAADMSASGSRMAVAHGGPIVGGFEPAPVDRERYPDTDPNPVKRVTDEPVSTFSVDVDTASYAVARRFLSDGVLPPTDAIRAEEVINYFDYDYPLPASDDVPFNIFTSLAPAPWNANADILHIGLKGYDVVPDEAPNANIVFLLDVSGSMNSDDKLPLLKKSLRMLINELDRDDRVSIVVYAGAAGVVLEPTPGDQRAKILEALDDLSAGGSTAGGEGLRRAYQLAEANFDEDAVNRVILATDGDFNVGVTSDERLEDFVARKRDTGVYLSVLGFGRGNYNDRLMQAVAQAGNGTAAYIDTLDEARKVLKEEFTSTLFPIANDVKIQVEFNPAQVAEYRLIGYETRLLDEADFANDEVDAGEIGAGHEVTALYEIVYPGSDGRRLPDRRYETSAAGLTASSDLATVAVRFKRPGEDVSTLIERAVTPDDRAPAINRAPRETQFAAAVAGYAQLLAGAPYMGEWGYEDAAKLANRSKGRDEYGWRSQFVRLARAADTAADMEALERPGRPEGPQPVPMPSPR